MIIINIKYYYNLIRKVHEDVVPIKKKKKKISTE